MLETKRLSLEESGLKFQAGARAVTLAGYASTWSAAPDSKGDVVERGAFANTIKAWKGQGRWPRMLLDHQGPPIGKWLDLREDDRGLFVEGELTPGHSIAADVAASLKHGAIDGLSIGYRASSYDVDRKSGVRRLLSVHLGEVSIVGNPANEGARITSVKGGDIRTLREYETFLRDHGWSRSEAELIAKSGFAGLLDARESPAGQSSDGAARDEQAAVAAIVASLQGLSLKPS